MSQPPRLVPLDTYWGVIQSGARARLTTARLWAAVHHHADLANRTIGPGAFKRMSQLRKLAGTQIRADAALARLPREGAITADQIALDINSRDPAIRALAPRYRVSFDVAGTRISTGERVTVRLTDTFGPSLPATRGELEDQLSIEAPGLGQDSDLVLEALAGNLSIHQV